jgi:putative FmdB family regulatory protein
MSFDLYCNRKQIMPTYEYRCENGHTFEEFQSIVANPVEICPVCGAKVERLISGGTGLIFKGSGFYITDYAHKNSSSNSSYARSAKSDQTAETKSASESTPKAETKSETKSEPASTEKKDKPE